MASRHFLRRLDAVRRPLVTSPLVCSVRAAPSQVSNVREFSGIAAYFRDMKERFTTMWEIKQEIKEEQSTQIHMNLREEFAQVYKMWDDVSKDLKQYKMNKELEEKFQITDAQFKSLRRICEEFEYPNEVADKELEEFSKQVDDGCNTLRKRMEEIKSQIEVADKGC